MKIRFLRSVRPTSYKEAHVIKLIKPVIYTTKENGVYVDKTDKDEPFEGSSPESEADLVSRGFAMYVNKPEPKSANEGTEKKKASKKK